MANSTFTTSFTAQASSGYGETSIADPAYWSKIHEDVNANNVVTNSSTIYVGSCSDANTGNALIERAILTFDTSSLAQFAKIADLEIEIETLDQMNSSAGIAIYASEDPQYPHDPIEKGDFSLEHYTKIGKITEEDIEPGSGFIPHSIEKKTFNPYSRTMEMFSDMEQYSEADLDKGNVVKRDGTTGILLIALHDEKGNKPINPQNCQRFTISGTGSGDPPKINVDWCPKRYIEWDDNNPSRVTIGSSVTFHGSAFDENANPLIGDQATIIKQTNTPVRVTDQIGSNGNWTISTSFQKVGDYWMFAKLPKKDPPENIPVRYVESEPPSRTNTNGSFATHKVTVTDDAILSTSFPTSTIVTYPFDITITSDSSFLDDFSEVSAVVNAKNNVGEWTEKFSVGGTIHTTIPSPNVKKTVTYVTHLQGSKEWLERATETDVTEIKGRPVNITMDSEPTFIPVGDTATWDGHLSTNRDIDWSSYQRIKDTIKEREIYLKRAWTENGSRRTEFLPSFDVGLTGDFTVEYENKDRNTEELFCVWPKTKDNPRFQQSTSNTIQTNVSVPTRLSFNVDEQGTKYGSPWEFSGNLEDTFYDKNISHQMINFTILTSGLEIGEDVTSGDNGSFSFTYNPVEGGSLTTGNYTVRSKYPGGPILKWRGGNYPSSPEDIYTETTYASCQSEITITLTQKEPSISFNINDTNPVPSAGGHDSEIKMNGWLQDLLNPGTNKTIYIEKSGVGNISTLSTGIAGGYNYTHTTNGVGNYDFTAKWGGSEIWNSVNSTITVNVSKETPRLDLIPSTDIPFQGEAFSLDGFLLSDHGASESNLTTNLVRGGSTVDTGSTDSNGEFNLQDSVTSTGPADYRVDFPGNNQLSNSSSATKTVQVIDEPSRISPKGRVLHNGTEITFESIDIDINALAKSDSCSISLNNENGQFSGQISYGHDISVQMGWGDQSWSVLPILFEGEVTGIDEGLGNDGEVMDVDAEDKTIKYNNMTLDDTFEGSMQDIIIDMFQATQLDDDFSFNLYAPDGERYERMKTWRDKDMIKGLEDLRGDADQETNGNFIFYTDDSTFNFRKQVNNQDSPDVSLVGSNITSIDRGRSTSNIENRIKVRGGYVLQQFTESWTTPTSVQNEWPEFIVSRGIARKGLNEAKFGREPKVTLNGDPQTAGDDYDILDYGLGKIEFNKSNENYKSVKIEYWNRRRLYSYDYSRKSNSDGLYEDDLKWIEDSDSMANNGKKEKVLKTDVSPMNQISDKNDLEEAREVLNRIGESYLQKRKDPYKNLSIEVPGMLRTRPEQRMSVKYPDLSIDTQYTVREIEHNLDKGGGLSTSMELNEPRPSMDELLQDIMSDINV